MAISTKSSPKVDPENMERVVQQIYTDLNEIINSVNSGKPSEAKKESSGKEGDLRLSKRSDGVYEIQGRTSEGWISATNLSFTTKDEKK